MLGLTLSCARCHDHKFDPITTRDYYGLYGFFASTRYPFPGIELFQTQHDLVPLLPAEDVAEALGPFESKTQELEENLERLLTACEEMALEHAAREAQTSLAEQRQMRDELDALLLKARKAGEQLAEHLKTVPVLPRAYAVQDASPVDARIQLKGEPTRPGARVPRKFPDILGGHSLAEELAQTGSGRRQLAGWIVNPDNPLTARVIVNRIWQRHFGEGLVPSTSDFGLRGQPPTHPALLDWLASEFILGGWSIKHMHRLILNSRTYQLSSRDIEENLLRDPGNQLLWKFNRQRLDAESLRDTLLSLAGNLDGTPQREPYPIPAQQEWKYTQHHPFKDDYPSQKRSVYVMTRRLTAQPYFQNFDGPDPNVCTGDRDQSVTPLQALFFVNDDFVHQQAEKFVHNLFERAPSEVGQGALSDRAVAVFATILCREPEPDEVRMMVQHVQAVENRLRQQDAGDAIHIEQRAWTSLTRSLFRTNEFLYLD
jgi:hypothetical protein